MTTVKLEELQQEVEGLTTEDAILMVTVSVDNPLKMGTHLFELTVVDEAGNQSQPAQVKVIVRDTEAPTAVLTAVDANGRALSDNVLEFGASFGLSAKGSLDLPPGKIVRYVWRLVEPIG